VSKKVLFVAFQFPPQAGPGVHRSVQFVKRLPALGYKPIVITQSIIDVEHSSYPKDESLMKHFSDDLVIHRFNSNEPLNLVRLLMKLRVFRIFWILAYPLFWERAAMWYRNNIKDIEEIVKEHDIQLVYTSSSPFSAWLIGRMLQKRLGIKWVADLRDPFTDGYMWKFPTIIHWWIARLFEKSILAKADKIIVTTPEVRRWFIKRRISEGSNIKVITNGF
jgi:glycosyltransferase involved in cell wall biosynthesis